MNNYHNTGSVNTMMDTRLTNPSWAPPQNTTHYVLQNHTLPHCYSNRHLSANRLRKHHSQSYQHIQISKDTYKWSFFPHTIIQWNMLPQQTVQSTTIDILREQLTLTVLYPLL
jgi:hypothetical protein